MQLTDFNYHLPEQLIAQHPLTQRAESRLLCLGLQGLTEHKTFKQLPEYLAPGDLLVMNDTRVIPARLYGQKDTGGKVEILIERILDNHQVLAQCRASKAPKPGSWLLLEEALSVEVISREESLWTLRFEYPQGVLAALAVYGRMPLPPYIARKAQPEDDERYQSVFASSLGAVAAPTASLHFDESLLSEIEAQGVKTAKLTLHVGAGTFQPVRTDNILQHKMHAEWMSVPQSLCEQIHSAKADGRRVIAIGTTVVRALESAAKKAKNKQIEPYSGETDIFIYPGFDFKIVDAMVTNFHLPQSTLLMLVSAFAGQSAIMAAYQEAIANEYRFFSYGDAMFITRSSKHAV